MEPTNVMQPSTPAQSAVPKDDHVKPVDKDDSMKLAFIQTLGHKIFRIDDVSDEAPMVQIEFFNEFHKFPYEARRDAAKAGMEEALKVLFARAKEIAEKK